MPPLTNDELLEKLDGRMDGVERLLNEVLICWRQRGDTCPYRTEVITLGLGMKDHEKRLGKVEGIVGNLIGGLGGSGILAVVGMVLFKVGQAAGWWK